MKHGHTHSTPLLIGVAIAIGAIGFGIGRYTTRNTLGQDSDPIIASVQEEELLKAPIIEQGLSSTEELPQYQPKQFALAGKISGLSAEQINQHLTLYKGYVKKRNEIEHDLKTMSRESAANKTYSVFRGLKVAQTYAVNGSLLHELYFENMIPDSQLNTNNVGPEMKQLIIKSFGSLEQFKRDFMDCGGTARGWVITGYGMDDGLLHNYVLEEHNQHVPVLTIPLLVLDCYEHAYMIDYGIKRDPYLAVFWKHINWQAIEKRIARWITPLNH